MNRDTRSQDWDDIIVGAGSAGAVLAARLSEQYGRRVLLIEAGQDFTTLKAMPAALRNAAEPIGSDSGFTWDLQAMLGSTSRWRDLLRAVRLIEAGAASDTSRVTPAAGSTFPYSVGKVTGGSSAVNGAIALRGVRNDFAQWASAGNPEWGWDQVLPYYKKLEADQDFEGPLHGGTGPIPIGRRRTEVLYPFQRGFLDACAALSLQEIDDLNGNDHVGVGRTPTNSKSGIRFSTAIAYLEAARGRPNLEILSGSVVQKVLFEGNRAIGVEISDDNGSRRILATRVTLSAGAIHTPAILQRSGVGNAQLCRALGITPVVDLPGVGENLADHAVAVIWAVPKPGVCEAGQYPHQVMARIASDPAEAYDLQLMPLTMDERQCRDVFGDLLQVPLAAGICVMLAQPLSRGRVFIGDRSPVAPPVIELNLCSDARDTERLMHGVRAAWKALHTPSLSACIERILLWTDSVVDDDKQLRKAVMRFVNPILHPVGTAKMGSAEDRLAVVDQHLCVHGLENLHVVDASVMPFIPRVPPNLTCIMLAERAAEWMRRDVSVIATAPPYGRSLSTLQF